MTRRHMQDELLRLWDDLGFTLLFVTHSIEEAVLLGSRILLLSPHPGRICGELNVPVASDDSRQALARRIHGILFGEDARPGKEGAARG